MLFIYTKRCFLNGAIFVNHSRVGRCGDDALFVTSWRLDVFGLGLKPKWRSRLLRTCGAGPRVLFLLLCGCPVSPLLV